MTTTSRYFRLIDPLSPPAADSELGCLTDLVAEAATWFFYDRVFDGAADEKRMHEEPSMRCLIEGIDAVQKLLGGQGKRSLPPERSPTVLRNNDGVRLVELFCDKFIAKEVAHPTTLSTGR